MRSRNIIDFSQFCQWGVSQVEVGKENFAWYVIDLAKEYPPIDFLLKYNGVGCLPRGDLQAMAGKLKSGKTFACICMEVAMLRGEYMGFEAQKASIKILHVDTEQSPGNIVDRVRVVHALCGWPTHVNSDRYRVITLRECSTEERLGKIVEAIEQFMPDFVLIDGVRDLCADFNDIGESSSLVGKLMGLCNRYRVGIMNILHENKNDTNMRGHLGSELGNKSSEIYQVSRDKSGKVSVEQTACRNAPVEKWSFSICDGVPQPETASYLNKTQLRRDEILISIFKRKASYTYTELVTEFMPMYGCEERWAKKLIGEALTDGRLRKEGDLYHCILLPSDDELF